MAYCDYKYLKERGVSLLFNANAYLKTKQKTVFSTL